MQNKSEDVPEREVSAGEVSYDGEARGACRVSPWGPLWRAHAISRGFYFLLKDSLLLVCICFNFGLFF